MSSPYLIMISSKAVAQFMSQGLNTFSEWTLPAHIQQSYEANISPTKTKPHSVRQTCHPIRKVSAINIKELNKCLDAFLHVGEKECQTKFTEVLPSKVFQKLDPILSAIHTRGRFHLDFDNFERDIRVIVDERSGLSLVNFFHSIEKILY